MQTQENTKKEILSFGRAMIFQRVLLFVGFCAGLWVSRYCFLAIAAFTVLSSFGRDLKNVFYQLLFSLPFTMVYKLSPSGTSLFAYAMIAVGVVLIVRVNKFKGAQTLLIALFGGYALVGVGGNYTLYIKMIVGLFLFYLFVEVMETSDFKNLIGAFTLGVLGSSFIGLFKTTSPQVGAYFRDMKTMYIGGEESHRFTGLYLDPNYYSIAVIFALTLCFMLYYYKRANRGVLAAFSVALVLFGSLSYSKMFLLSLALIGAIFGVNGLKSPRTMIATLFGFAVGFAMICKWALSSTYATVMTKRFLDGDVSTGRFDIWSAYVRHIDSSLKTLFFGDGLGAEYLVVDAPHNSYLEIVYFVGLLGGAIFLATLFSIFRGGKRNINRGAIHYVLPLVFCFMCSVLGCFTINDLAFYCMLLWLAYNFGAQKEEERDFPYWRALEGRR